MRRTAPRGERADIAHLFTSISSRVRDAGLLGRARWFYLALGGGLLLALGGAVAGFVLLGDSWFQLIIAGALGIILTQFAFFAHEAAHKQVMASGPSNDRLGRFLAVAVVGMSYSWWMSKHTRHHGNPNQMGRDPDIEQDTVSFTVESAAKQSGWMGALTRRQGYLFFPLLLLEGLNLHYTSIRSLSVGGPVKGRTTEFVLLGLRFSIYLGVLFTFLPLGTAFAFLGVQLAVFGLYMGAAFAPNHTGMPIIPADARLDFFSKQVRTSRNIAGGWWASVIYGGLNYQVEHHLFPNMPRPHLAKARVMVREHCRANDVPYTETSMGQAYVTVVRYLNEVGLHARDPFACPVVGAYRRA